MSIQGKQFQIQHPRTQFKFNPPKYTLGYLIIVVVVTIATSVVILSGQYSKCQADGQKIIDQKQWYRIITSPFAVGSFLDLFFMFLSFLWLLFTLTEYERSYSTIYVLFDFVNTNILIIQGVAFMYWIMFTLTGMKNFIMNLSGIFPYALYVYLKGPLNKPGEVVNHWFLPFPITRWVMGFLVSIILILTVPQTQGCMVVFFHYLFCSFLVLLKRVTKLKCFYIEGPLIKILWICFQKLVPGCIKSHPGFSQMQQCVKKLQQIQQEQIKKTIQQEQLQYQNQQSSQN